MQETWVQSLGQEDPLEKAVATCSSILAWRIPWTGEAGGPQSVESQKGGDTIEWLNTHTPQEEVFSVSCTTCTQESEAGAAIAALPPFRGELSQAGGWSKQSGEAGGRAESWWGQLNACVEPCQKPAPSTGVQFSLGLFVRFLPSVPVVAWATVLIQCVSFLSRRTFPSSNPTCVPFELSQRACLSLCFSWDVQPH